LNIDLSFEASTLNNQFFNEANDMSKKARIEQILLVFYFSFTTLTTVGFGDITPRGD
jgi:hypothetical protein